MNKNPNLPLERQLISILAANREDSFATQRKRGYALGSVARTLHERFGLQKWDNLKAKHVTEVVKCWKLEDEGHRGIEEKLSHFRWLVRKIGKANLIPRTNEELGIAPGPRKTRAGKTVSEERLAGISGRISDPRVRAAILLGRYLGLRFKEAMLLRPWRDWQGNRVWVKRGTKGGRPRYVFVHNPRQREALMTARFLTKRDGSLVPPEAPTFEKWRQQCYRALRAAGMGQASNTLYHDLRRTYAAERMKYLLARGVSRQEAARLVARELGHGRTEVLGWYLEDSDDAQAA